jgi:hypothetical protein
MKMPASLLLLAALSLGVVINDPASRTVEVTLSGGRMFKGEVIAVRESTVVLGTRTGLSPVEMLNDSRALIVAPFTQVQRIATEKNTHPITGMLIGAPAGCLGGLAIGGSIPVEKQPNDTFGCGAQAEHESNQASGMLVGFFAGAAIGCLVGNATGEPGQVVISAEQRDFTFLKELARYPYGEPESLQKIGR